MTTISLEMAKMESLLLSNRKFAKKWLKMLNKHINGCPCLHYGYIKFMNAGFKFNECPFNIRKNNENYTDNCYRCDFSKLLNPRYLKYYHIKSAIKSVVSLKLT